MLVTNSDHFAEGVEKDGRYLVYYGKPRRDSGGSRIEKMENFARDGAKNNIELSLFY